MITLMLMFLACESNKAETTNTANNAPAEQVETTVAPTTTKVKETPVNNDNNNVVEVKTVENTANANSEVETTEKGDNNATND